MPGDPIEALFERRVRLAGIERRAQGASHAVDCLGDGVAHPRQVGLCQDVGHDA